MSNREFAWKENVVVRAFACSLVLSLASSCLLLPTAATAQVEEERWKSPSTRWLEPRSGRRATVPGYLDEMKWKNLPQEVVLIAGSATARGWNNEKWFSDFRTINRGFGGSRIDDNTYFADQLIIPYHPSTIIFYAGDNDLWARKPVDLTVQHFQDFVTKIRAELPLTQIVFVSIRPSIARWEIVGAMREANTLIRTIVEQDPNLYYADIDPIMIGEDGKPRPELFIADDLHLTELGFLEWTRLVKPIVQRAEERYRKLKSQYR